MLLCAGNKFFENHIKTTSLNNEKNDLLHTEKQRVTNGHSLTTKAIKFAMKYR